jgi:hypothetical protein
MLAKLSPGRAVTIAGVVAGGIGIVMWINGIEDQQAMARHLLLIGAIMTSVGALGWEIGDAGRRKD